MHLTIRCIVNYTTKNDFFPVLFRFWIFWAALLVIYQANNSFVTDNFLTMIALPSYRQRITKKNIIVLSTTFHRF